MSDEDDKVIDGCELAKNRYRVEGYLLAVSPPADVMASFNWLCDQFYTVNERLDQNLRLDRLIDGVPIPVEDAPRKRQSWTNADKEKVWRMRFIDNKKPSEIAEMFTGRKGSDISNLIQQMKAAKYSLPA